jgi:hypothetical protein
MLLCIFNTFSANVWWFTKRSPVRLFKGIVFIDMIIFIIFRLVLHSESYVRTKTPEDKGSRISSKLNF